MVRWRSEPTTSGIDTIPAVDPGRIAMVIPGNSGPAGPSCGRNTPPGVSCAVAADDHAFIQHMDVVEITHLALRPLLLCLAPQPGGVSSQGLLPKCSVALQTYWSRRVDHISTTAVGPYELLLREETSTG